MLIRGAPCFPVTDVLADGAKIVATRDPNGYVLGFGQEWDSR